ncbi:glycosyltransferase [Acinetobacter sp. YH12085]|uniref:glycosyltransferase n=1 Tax=Acinetobacter sp. YH12085 TaxID=2601077 RepID=UPI0015D31814|nr:glycosyltransferase [Acinetobacter sp. YH12085]
MKVLVLGYFGYVTNQIDGQTIKTRDVYSVIQSNCTEDLDYFDTQSFKNSRLNVLKMIWKIIVADKIFYLPAHNNLKYLFPIVFILSVIFKADLNYLVVGGWLFKFLKNKPIHRLMLKNISGIYVETNDLYNNLKQYSFNNVHKLHNFRVIDLPKLKDIDKNKTHINMVFMARVHPMKGVDTLFNLEKKLNELNIDNFSIDVYGPIFEDYKDEFLLKIKDSKINYKGIVEPIDVYSILSDYDITLFPTKYYTEGFPGTILDSYIVGIPVLVTNWINANEFVKNNETGYVVDFNDPNAFVDKAVDLIQNPNNIFSLRSNIELMRNQYSADKAWEVLSKVIYNKERNI